MKLKASKLIEPNRQLPHYTTKLGPTADWQVSLKSTLEQPLDRVVF